MKHPPKYFGTVTETQKECELCKKKGTVWNWKPNIQGSNMNMDAHTKCFRKLWKGEY